MHVRFGVCIPSACTAWDAIDATWPPIILDILKKNPGISFTCGTDAPHIAVASLYVMYAFCLALTLLVIAGTWLDKVSDRWIRRSIHVNTSATSSLICGIMHVVLLSSLISTTRPMSLKRSKKMKPFTCK